MTTTLKAKLQEAGALEYYTAMAFETLAFWQEQERKHPSELNRFNISYFEEFIKYLNDNKSEA